MNSTSLLSYSSERKNCKYMESKNVMRWQMSYKSIQNHQWDYILHQFSPPLWIDKIPFKSEFDGDSSKTEFTRNNFIKVSETCVVIPSAVRIGSPIISNSTIKESHIRRKKYASHAKLSTTRRSIIKTESYKSILIAKPDRVCFHNFEKNRLYKKIITLTNVSNILTRFRIEPKSSHSKFIVIIRDKNRKRNLIAAGMQLKLIVLFYTEDMCEQEKIITVHVQHGKSIDIKLQCTRDPPILKRIKKPYLQCLASQIHDLSVKKSITISSDSWESYTTKHSTTDSESNRYYTEKSLIYENSNMIVECGKCFVGEQIALQIKFRNSGGEGKFFLISEIDWYSMCIEDVTDTNILALQSFAIWPAYFILKTEEDIFIHTYFFPDSYGMHVDALYIISDNYSFKSIELIGDGIMYESRFFQINGSEGTRLFLESIDMQAIAHYCLNFQLNSSKEFIRNQILITNTSKMYMFFRWEKCAQIDNKNEITDSENFLDCLQIQPESGIFPASDALKFNIIITIPQIDLHHNQVYGFFQLYIEDIPQAAIPKKDELWTVESKIKRRVCSNSVDILVADIKLTQYLHFDITIENKSWILDKYINVSDEEDIFQITESIKEQWSEDQYTDIARSRNENCISMPVLMLEELHSTLNIIDIGPIKSCLFESVFISGVLRPFKLFVGVEEILTVHIKNKLSIPVSYKWGNPIGLDSLKLKLIFSPDSGCIPAGIIENIQILCCPNQIGYIKSLHIPCYIENLDKTMLLQVECEIKSLYVTLHIPYSNDKSLKVSERSICVEWSSSSISVHPDLLEIQKFMLNKTIFKHDDIEESYMDNKSLNTEIDSQDVSVESVESWKSFEIDQRAFSRENIISDNTEMESLDFQNSEDFTDKINWIKDKTEKVIHFNASKQLVPFQKIKRMEQLVIIEFIGVPLGIVTKKTFLIRNETPIASSFWVRVNNFYPVYITQKEKIKEDMIKSIFKKIIGHQTEDVWKEIKQPHSGILIYVNPLITRLGPYENVFVDIYVFVDTWGIYVDELEINIVGLPQYILPICVQVTEMPISFPICEKTQLKIPVCRFGTLSASSLKENRIVMIKNRSSVPLMINWQIVSIESVSESHSRPFNVILKMHIPFTNKLAIGLRKMQRKSSTKKLSRNRLEICSFQNNYCQQLKNQTFEIFSYEHIDTSALPKNDNYSYTDESKTIEFQIDLIHYNLMNTNICTVHPEETFISPKGKAYVGIKVFPDKCPLDKDRYKILCNALGFIHIAPMDKYKEKHYYRHDNLLTPIKIQIEADIIKSKLVYDIPKSDRYFIFCVDDIMKNSQHVIKSKKTFTFYNKAESPIYAKFGINGPFIINYISTPTNNIMDNPMEGIDIESCNFVQVHIASSVDAKLIEEIIETNSNMNLQYKPKCSKHKNTWCDRGLLLVTYADDSFEAIELFLKIHLPLLHLSSCSLNFGDVCIGETKKFLLDIENLSACKCKVEINKTMLNEDFSYEPVMGEILARPATGKHILSITICFSPRNVGPSKEILKIMSALPNYEEKCVLCGTGISDIKTSEIEL